MSLCLFLSCGPLFGVSEEERFVGGLRERRLFRTAESYCEAQLQRPKLSEADRASLTIEYMLTLSQHAAYSPPGERDVRWQQATDLAQKFPADHPRKLLIDLQAALVWLAQGELARQEAEAGATPDFIAAQSLLRQASKGLDELERKLAQQIAQKRDLAPPGTLTSEELFAVQHNVRYQLARSRRNLALCYGAGSDDRVAALQQSLEQLGKLKTQLADDEPLMYKLKIDEGIGARLLEDNATASRILSSLLSTDVPLLVQLHARAELARLALSAGRPDEAQRVIAAGKRSAELLSAELEFALLETLVALWKQADRDKDTQNAGRFRQQAVDQLAAIERQFGAYWSRRGERLVIDSAGAGDANLDILARSADARFLKNQFDAETLAVYDKAAQMALNAGNVARYLELAYRAAIVQDKRQQQENFTDRLLALGEIVAEHPKSNEDLQKKAAAAHLLGLQRLLIESQTNASRRANIDTATARHQELWPKSATSSLAVFALAEQKEKAAAWDEAIAAYKQVHAEHSLAGEAALRAGRLTLEHSDNGHAAAEAWLRAALDRFPNTQSPSREAVEALLVVALAGQPTKRGEAEKILAQLGTDSPARLLEMLAGLAKLSAVSGERTRRDLAALELKAIDLLLPQTAKLTAEQRLALARLQAEALLASGQYQEALAKYEQLAKAQPQSAAIQEGYATALAVSGDRKQLTKALAQWRIIAQRSKPQTERWYRAKYEVAHLNYRLGDKEQAAQLIRYLQVTPPGLQGTTLERSFAELLDKCKS